MNALWPLLRQTVAAWSADRASSMGAALSYYTLFSIAPLLLIVISVAGLVFGEAAARGEIIAQLDELLGRDGARAVEALLKSVSEPREGVLATAAGVVALLLGATGVFGELQSDLDRIWRAPQPEAGGFMSLLRTRLLAFGLVLGFAFLLIVSLVVSAVIAALGKWWSPVFGAWEFVAQALNVGVGFALTTVLFAMIYKLMPRVNIAWPDVWVGAAVTSLLFAAGRLAIGLYLGRSGVASAFGAAGSLVLVMVWVYYSAQIFLLGAEFTWVYAHLHGSRRGHVLDLEAKAAERRRATRVTAQEIRQATLAARGAAPGPWIRLGVATGLGLVAGLLARRRRGR